MKALAWNRNYQNLLNAGLYHPGMKFKERPVIPCLLCFRRDQRGSYSATQAGPRGVT